MSLTVEVMYSDLSIRKYYLDEFSNSQRYDILFILFKKDDKNLFSLNGADYYGIYIDNDSIKYIQFDESDGAIYRIDLNSDKTTQEPIYRMSWIPQEFDVYEGQSVTHDVWEKAVKKFYAEMSNP